MISMTIDLRPENASLMQVVLADLQDIARKIAGTAETKPAETKPAARTAPVEAPTAPEPETKPKATAEKAPRGRPKGSGKKTEKATPKADDAGALAELEGDAKPASDADGYEDLSDDELLEEARKVGREAVDQFGGNFVVSLVGEFGARSYSALGRDDQIKFINRINAKFAESK